MKRVGTGTDKDYKVGFVVSEIKANPLNELNELNTQIKRQRTADWIIKSKT